MEVKKMKILTGLVHITCYQYSPPCWRRNNGESLEQNNDDSDTEAYRMMKLLNSGRPDGNYDNSRTLLGEEAEVTLKKAG